MKKVDRPNYDMIKSSIITSIQINYNEYKNYLKKYLDNSWYNSNGELSILEGCEKYINDANLYMGKVFDDRRLLGLCNVVINEEKDDYNLSDNEMKLLKELNFM